MKKVLLLAVLAAFACTAIAQDTSATGSAQGTTKSAKSKKKSDMDASSSSMSQGGSKSMGKMSTLTGCVSSSAGSDGNYMLSNGRYKNGVSIGPSDKVKDHAGHQVSLKGTWSGDKKMFNVDTVKHISETCSTAPGGGTMGSSGKKGKKGAKSDATSTPPGL